MEEVKMVESRTCAECIAMMGRRKTRKQIVDERIRLERCRGCEILYGAAKGLTKKCVR